MSLTPTQAARDGAAQTSAADTATFTVRAADNRGAYKDVTITVSVAATPATPAIPITSITSISVGDSPIGMTVAGNHLYVLNSGDNTCR